MIGLLGGTFDPVHCGHLDVARAALDRLSLERVLFIPAHIPPHRGVPGASAADRLAMVRLAIRDEPRFEASTIEIDAAGPSYTSVTIDRFLAQGYTKADLCFIAGADAFAGVASWHDYPALLDRCRFAVVSRPGFPASAVPAQIPAFAEHMTDIFLIDALTAPVSSTAVRASIDRGAPLTGLVPDAVASYIAAHRLYEPEAHGH
jgi:nicotinate-nucleotide adenylyltransferase